MKKKHVKISLIAFFLIVAFLAGCAGGTQSSGQTTQATQTEQSSQNEQTTQAEQSTQSEQSTQAEQSTQTEQSAQTEQTTQTEKPAQTDQELKPLVLSYATTVTSQGVDYNSDDLAKVFEEKFNVTFDVISMSPGEHAQQGRVWINAGNMPDAMWWELNPVDYASYVDQGLLKALPDDYATRYPDLSKSMDYSGVIEPLANMTDGRTYCVPQTIFVNMPTSFVIPHATMQYRKDWLEQIGEEPLPLMVTIMDLMDIAKKFMDQDPGGNGPGNTMGIFPWKEYILGLYVSAANPYYDRYHKVDGKYVWGPAESATLEGLKLVKGYYDDGTIYHDFFSVESREYRDSFYAEKVGLMYDDGDGAVIQATAFGFASGSGKNPLECIGYCGVLGTNGKYRGHEQMNIWNLNLFSPQMDDEKFERFLSFMDYTCTQEGQDYITLGFEGKDYKKENNEIVVTRELNPESGDPKMIKEIYRFADVVRCMVILPDDFALRDPGFNEVYRNTVYNIYQEKEKNGDIGRIDYGVQFFSGPNYSKMPDGNRIVRDEMLGLILQSGDIEENWNEWVKQKQPIIEPVLQELNDALT